MVQGPAALTSPESLLALSNLRPKPSQSEPAFCWDLLSPSALSLQTFLLTCGHFYISLAHLFSPSPSLLLGDIFLLQVGEDNDNKAELD